MVLKPEKQTFVERYLDPASRLGEVLFGLIMVLTVTLTAGLNASEPSSTSSAAFCSGSHVGRSS